MYLYESVAKFSIKLKGVDPGPSLWEEGAWGATPPEKGSVGKS